MNSVSVLFFIGLTIFLLKSWLYRTNIYFLPLLDLVENFAFWWVSQRAVSSFVAKYRFCLKLIFFWIRLVISSCTISVSLRGDFLFFICRCRCMYPLTLIMSPTIYLLDLFYVRPCHFTKCFFLIMLINVFFLTPQKLHIGKVLTFLWWFLPLLGL